MEAHLRCCLRSLRDLLVVLGVEALAAAKVASLIHAGSPDAGLFAGFHLEKSPGGLAGARASLPPLLDMVAEFTPRLRRGELREGDLQEVAQTLAEIGDLAEALGAAPQAYNVHEAVHELLVAHDRPGLAAAEALRRLSDPQKIRQYHADIWRLAVARLHHACDHQADWLPALDALELALTCPVPDPGLQQLLLERLNVQVARAEAAGIEGLTTILTLQGPRTAVDPDLRQQLVLQLASVRWGAEAAGIDPTLQEIRAFSEAQAAFEDMRLRFLPRKAAKPRLDLHDLTYHDGRLTDAVPLGLSLVADPRRTAKLLPAMAHEIGHAVVLQGALGARQAVYRAVVSYCEFLLQSETTGASEAMPLDRLAALAELPAGGNARALADMQLAAAEKAAIERAVWRPWLEGVSMYIELLCDPKDDPTRISPVHHGMRSLIDFGRPKQAGDAPRDEAAQVAQAAVEQFEAFLSDVIAKQSRLDHGEYFGLGPPEREIYCLGYLLVRAIVAAWEKTLERHLPPGLAIRLLIEATQAGSFEALPDPLEGAPTHWDQAQRRYLTWLRALAELGKEELEAYFRPTPKTERGTTWLWRNGHLHPADPEGAATASLQGQYAMLAERHVAALAGLDPATTDADQRVLLTALHGILARQLAWNRLLPIGSDRSRLMFLNRPGVVSLMVRSYAGDAEKAAASPGGATTYGPRYNIRSWRLDGGEAEADRLRQALGRAGTARLRVTRILDLTGHPDAPRHPDPGSYTCAFLPPDFIWVMDGLTNADVSKSHPAFAKVLASRLFPPVAFPEEGTTIASLPFLGERAKRSRFDPPLPAPPSNESLAGLSQSIALNGAALAFAGGSAEQFRTAYDAAMQVPAWRIGLANLLYASGRSLPLTGKFAFDQQALKGKALTKLVLDAAAFSAVKPFGGMP